MLHPRVSLIMLMVLFPLISWSTGTEENGYPYGIPFEKVNVPIYLFQELTPQTALRMDYAQSSITNPHEWQRIRHRVKPTEIELVFTAYPLDSSRWMTSYNYLLKERLKSLFALDPLLNDKSITWKLVLQTKCQSAEQASRFFHGFVIKYDVVIPQVINHPSTVFEIEKIISGEAQTQDSTVLKVMERNHHEWGEDVLVVMDWTGSMYRYGAQVVLWHKLNFDHSGIRHFVFFNDGNRKTTPQKIIGRTGGIYYTQSQDIFKIIETMNRVMSNGYGGDSPENDLEAILKSIKKVENYKEVILIADNGSVVRDLALLQSIDKPVRVILCGAKRHKLNPDYIKIAFKTKGSIHTIDEDIISMAQLREGDMIYIEGYRYKVRAGELELFD